MKVEIPKVQSVGDVYILTWPEHKIKIRLERIIETSQAVSGELMILLNHTTKPQALYHTRLNLLSASSKKTLANELSQRMDIDWSAILEQTTILTLKEYRRGEPTIKVGDLPQREKGRFRIKPFVLEKELSAIFAYGGSAKSTLAILFAVMVQTGTSFLGMEVIKGNALLLDWESSKEDIDEIVKAIKTGMNIESDELPYYRRCHRILPNEISEIQAQVLEKDIDFIMLAFSCK